MPELNEIGIVIVAHNSVEVIGACLDAALAESVEIVVVDNASRDGTREEVLRRRGVGLIANPWNRGFAAAANQGMAGVRRRYVLLLNPDVVLKGGLAALAAACSQPGIAAAGGKLLDEAGRPQIGFMVRRFPTALSLSFEVLGLNRLWPGNPVNRRYRCLDLDPDAPGEIEQPAGAFLMLQRGAWQRLGGFDEGFHPLWFEDVDFLKRARDAGYRALYAPAAVASHRGGHSAHQLSWERRQLYWYDSLLSYVAKHFRPSRLRATCLAVVVACVLRMILGIFSGSTKPFRVYSRIIRLAGVGLISGRGKGAGWYWPWHGVRESNAGTCF